MDFFDEVTKEYDMNVLHNMIEEMSTSIEYEQLMAINDVEGVMIEHNIPFVSDEQPIILMELEE